jgi:hypothetical protein
LTGKGLEISLGVGRKVFKKKRTNHMTITVNKSVKSQDGDGQNPLSVYIPLQTSRVQNSSFERLQLKTTLSN